ncbi:FAD:protein FMN transferase [Lysinibacillus sp. NPDC096418]|uniref:FAD:protein FMN transferase n=1 Tax=Lysinibacillus sp. NPDC096418 TaxID=3364138 RepID=UPI0038239846
MEMDTLSLQLMNTDFYIAIPKGMNTTWKDTAEKWLQYVAKEWSRFQPNNELSELNTLKIGEALRINSHLYDCLRLANDYYLQSNGLFSPYLKLQLERHGYNQSFPFAEAKQKSSQAHFIAGRPFQFLDNQQVMKVAHQEIDLGGFAKGYAIEKLAEWLENEVAPDYGMVDGGGDLKVWSTGEKVWKIGVADAIDIDKEISQIKIKTGAIATSNRIFRSWTQNNISKHHLLNGRTGEVAKTDVIQATVVTSTMCNAEVSAKLCFLVDASEQQQWFETNFQRSARFLVKEGQKGYWITSGGGANDS